MCNLHLCFSELYVYVFVHAFLFVQFLSLISNYCVQDPTAICGQLGLCNSTQKVAELLEALDILQPQAKQLRIPMMLGPVILTPSKKLADVCLCTLKTFNVVLKTITTRQFNIIRANILRRTTSDLEQDVARSMFSLGSR